MCSRLSVLYGESHALVYLGACVLYKSGILLSWMISWAILFRNTPCSFALVQLLSAQN